MFEIIVKAFQCEILIQRPGRKSTLRIMRDTNNVYSEIHKKGYFYIYALEKLKNPVEEYNIVQLREIYRDFIGMEAD